MSSRSRRLTNILLAELLRTGDAAPEATQWPVISDVEASYHWCWWSVGKLRPFSARSRRRKYRIKLPASRPERSEVHFLV